MAAMIQSVGREARPDNSMAGIMQLSFGCVGPGQATPAAFDRAPCMQRGTASGDAGWGRMMPASLEWTGDRIMSCCQDGVKLLMLCSKLLAGTAGSCAGQVDGLSKVQEHYAAAARAAGDHQHVV